MADSFRVPPLPPGRSYEIARAAPPSKSLTIRALAAAALAAGRSALRQPLFSDDTWRMAEALGALGLPAVRQADSILVTGQGGTIPAPGAALDLGDAGTPLRLLTALVCIGEGRFVLDGSRRMRERPVGDLLRALSRLGVAARSLHENGCPPVEVLAAGFPGGRVRLAGGVSSQFLSALLMAGPCGRADLEVEVDGDLVSRPYVDLTVQMMERFGARVYRQGYERFHVPAARSYEARILAIEGDASSASYLFGAAAITGGRVRVTGIPKGSQQGDLGFLPILEAMGCRTRHDEDGIVVEGGPLRGVEADLRDMPDVALTLAAVALFAGGPTRITGIGHLRLKESDRIAAAARAVAALGGRAEETVDTLTIHPAASSTPARHETVIDPAGDHRVAMAFALAGLRRPGVTIRDPRCVEKSWPGFFEAIRPGDGNSGS